ncbi:MAG: YkgJ family cysteine cluster protein [Candidatus Woesearchaeota archaeon]
MQQYINFDEDLQPKQPHNTFKFKCVVGCKLCCSMNDVALYPFDIMYLCNFLNISSSEFHNKYTTFDFDTNAKILRCYLKTNPVCVFFDNQKACTVYDARPVRCRTFPVGRMFNEDDTVEHFLPRQKCPGFESKQKHTIQSWIDNCGISDRKEMIKDWNKFIIQTKNRKDLPLEDEFFKMFFMKIFYDFDNELSKVSNATNKEIERDDILGRMEHLYFLSKIYLDNIDKWKEGYKQTYANNESNNHNNNNHNNNNHNNSINSI